MSPRPIINVSPFATNILDLVDVPLVSIDGRNVLVRRPMTEFVIYVDGREDCRHFDNLSASYRLNMLEVSRK